MEPSSVVVVIISIIIIIIININPLDAKRCMGHQQDFSINVGPFQAVRFAAS